MSNRFLRRLTLGLATLAGLLAAQAADAVTAPVLVVEVDSGKVLYAQGATDPWYPASITKLMTTYVALDLVRQGKVSLDSMITISAAAAAEPPSKMGFKPGTQLTLDNALKIIMVKSANDVAWAIGETLGGTIDGFADMMNETARRIGMRESRWYNPNGLPDPRQWTSARDMAVLGRALLRDFPDSHDLFSISAIQFGRSVMANHNGLLGRYAGVDG
ncbi:MAG: D-alanyl-D-alanine carboxypeptidase, partial [Methylobacterium sp.]